MSSVEPGVLGGYLDWVPPDRVGTVVEHGRGKVDRAGVAVTHGHIAHQVSFVIHLLPAARGTRHVQAVESLLTPGLLLGVGQDDDVHVALP